MNNKSAHQLFEKYKVLSETELESRYEILLEIYAKHINIEARTAINMVKTQYIPAVISYTGKLAKTVNDLKSAGASTDVQSALLTKINDLLKSASKKVATLEAERTKAEGIGHAKERAEAYHDKVFPAQTDLRADIDALETIVSKCSWPVPSYGDMLFDL